jgi:hypothetical protein
MRRFSPVAGCLAALLFAQNAAAHHAYAVFDVNREVTLQGVVRQFQWTSPHIWVDLLIRDASGRQIDWPIIGASPSILQRFGWRSDSMKPGDRIEMVVHPRKDGASGGSLVTAVVNGRVVGGLPRPT